MPPRLIRMTTFHEDRPNPRMGAVIAIVFCAAAWTLITLVLLAVL